VEAGELFPSTLGQQPSPGSERDLRWHCLRVEFGADVGKVGRAHHLGDVASQGVQHEADFPAPNPDRKSSAAILRAIAPAEAGSMNGMSFELMASSIV